ncbi:SIR2 family protein [Roseibium sp. MB-4]
MDFWDKYLEGEKELLRLLTREGKWLSWMDKEADSEDAATKRIPGCRDQVEGNLTNALHATNVVVLLGSGASFCAKNGGVADAPSMGSLWHAVRDAVNAQKILDRVGFDELAGKVMGGLPENEQNGRQKAGDIESLLSLCKMQIELLKVREKHDSAFSEKAWMEELIEFVRVAEVVILDKVDFVKPETDLPAHMAFVRKLARRSPEKPRVKLFTTNYDLCIETAASRLGVVLIDGFSHTAVQRFNRDHFQHDIVRRAASSTKADYLDGVFHLHKLHGSVDWRRGADGIVTRSQAKPAHDLLPVLIYPRSTKYQEAFETPYLDMFAALQAALREPDTTLIVSGFGFADDHISAPIWSAIETNLSLRVIICDRGFVQSELLEVLDCHEIDLDLRIQRAYQKKIIQLVQQGDGRITILNGRFEDLAHAFPEISGKTDRQLLQERLNRLGEGEA